MVKHSMKFFNHSRPKLVEIEKELFEFKGEQVAVTTACTRGFNIFCEVLLQTKQTSAVNFSYL